MDLRFSVLAAGLVLGLTCACGGTVASSNGSPGVAGEGGSGGNATGGSGAADGGTGGDVAGGTGGTVGGASGASGRSGAGGTSTGGASGASGASGTGGIVTGGAGGEGGSRLDLCPPRMVESEPCEPHGMFCPYDWYSGCLCRNDDYFYCELADPECPYGGAGEPNGDSGGDSEDVDVPCGPDGCGAEPPPPVIGCTCESSWNCQYYW